MERSKIPVILNLSHYLFVVLHHQFFRPLVNPLSDLLTKICLINLIDSEGKELTIRIFRILSVGDRSYIISWTRCIIYELLTFITSLIISAQVRCVVDCLRCLRVSKKSTDPSHCRRL